MQINYKFISDLEPTDEQLHLLMHEVAVEVKNKALKSDEQFFKQLQLLIKEAKKVQLYTNPYSK